ncbi:MAG: mechanosensitive ion channel family protein, partial [Cyanobacteria bacterium P01_F01_bin.42]
ACFLVIGLHGPLSHAQQPPQADDLADTVQLGSVPLFEIQSDMGAFTREERALAISRRLLRLVRESDLQTEQIRAQPQESGIDLLADDQVIMLLTNKDAEAAGTTLQGLANSHVEMLKDGIKAYYLNDNRETLLYRSLIAGAVTVAFFLVLIFLQAITPRIHRKILGLKGQKIRSFRVQSLEVLSADQISQALIVLTNLVKFFVRLGLVYIYLLTVLGLFPHTQFLAQRLIGYVIVMFQTMWAGFVDYLPNLVFIVVISTATYYLTRVVHFFCSALENELIGFPGFDQEWARPTYQILRFLFIAAAITLSIPYLPGSSSPAVQAMSIFFGILVSIGSTAVAANVVAGFALTYTRAFKVGDRVKIADTIGDVMEKTFLVTQIRTPKNMVVTIPNGMVLGDQIINYSANEKDQGLILHTQITLGYDVPWEKVHRVLIDAAIKTTGVLNDPEPFVLQKGLEDFYVSYELNAYTLKPTRMAQIYSELHQHIQDGCNENDIEILSPHYSAVRDGNETTIPESYRESGYEPPGFRLGGFNLLPKIVHKSHNGDSHA